MIRVKNPVIRRIRVVSPSDAIVPLGHTVFNFESKYATGDEFLAAFRRKNTACGVGRLRKDALVAGICGNSINVSPCFVLHFSSGVSVEAAPGGIERAHTGSVGPASMLAP